MTPRSSAGLTRIEVVCLLAVVFVSAAVTLPTLAGLRSSSGVLKSLDNLAVIGAGHALYSAEHGGRQLTHVDDTISTYGASADEAFDVWFDEFGERHPALVLGWAETSPGFFGILAYRVGSNCANASLLVPIEFPGVNCNPNLERLGSFRVMNAQAFSRYFNNRFYDPVFYAPNDEVAYDFVEPAFEESDQYYDALEPDHPAGQVPAWLSYVQAASAMYAPAVFRNPSDGGWQCPWTLDDGLASPGLFQATYPHLKTFVMEHNWVQNAPTDPCNPAFPQGTYGGCEPYYFNHGLDSEPATLFYDLSIRLLPNTEALAADQQAIDETGFGLWSRDTPFGEDGYWISAGLDGLPISHHVLTTGGIQGRDTTEGAGALVDMKALRKLKRLPRVRPEWEQDSLLTGGLSLEE